MKNAEYVIKISSDNKGHERFNEARAACKAAAEVIEKHGPQYKWLVRGLLDAQHLLERIYSGSKQYHYDAGSRRISWRGELDVNPRRRNMDGGRDVFNFGNSQFPVRGILDGPDARGVYTIVVNTGLDVGAVKAVLRSGTPNRGATWDLYLPPHKPSTPGRFPRRVRR